MGRVGGRGRLGFEVELQSIGVNLRKLLVIKRTFRTFTTTKTELPILAVFDCWFVESEAKSPGCRERPEGPEGPLDRW